jgi:hypothetical protein
MEIKKSAAIGGGTGGKQSTRKKQTVPRSLLDSVQIRANRTALTVKGKTKFANAKALDNNVHAARSEVDGSVGIKNT